MRTWYTELSRFFASLTASIENDEERRRVQMVMKLAGFHLILICLAGTQFLADGELPIPVLIQFALNGAILLLIFTRRFHLAVGLLLSTFVTSNFFSLFFSDLTNLLYAVTAFAATTILLKQTYRIPFACTMVGAVLILGHITAGNPQYASVTHDNVVMFVALGMLSISISTSVTTGDLNQIRSQFASLQASEARYRLLAENISDLIILHGADARLLYASPSYVRFTGYSSEEVSTWTIQDIQSLVHPDDSAYVGQIIYGALLSDKQPVRLRYRLRRKDASYFWAETHLTPIFDHNGQIERILSSTRDVTERVEMEAALRESNHRYDELVKNLPALVYTFRLTKDGQFRFDYLSPRCKEFTGYEAAEGLKDAELLNGIFPPEENERLWRLTRESMQSLQPYTFEGYTIVNGQQRWVRLDSRPRSLPNGDVVWDGIYTDITEQKIIEERQHSLTAELQSANRELKEFAYIVSHDLKVPVRGVSAIANWLSADYGALLDENGQRMLELLKGRARRMEAMINSVLEYARLGQDQQANTAVDLNQLVAEILADLSSTEACTITVDTPLPTLNADPIRMRQVFQNLIDNAIKYMDKPRGEIHITCQAETAGWLFCVRDNGPGIDTRHFDKIFRMFQTLNPRDEIEATGIGLTIVKRIVELYGGRIWVESIVGQGSSFIFTLPAKLTYETSRSYTVGGR